MNLSDSKSPQVYRALLSILADFDNTVVWMVSTRPLISKSSRPFINHLVTVLSAPITNSITVTYRSIVFFFSSLARSTIRQILFFWCWLLLGLVVWSSGRNLVICLYHKIPEEVVCFIFHDGFWVMLISFARTVKFKLLAKLPVDHLAHPVMLFCFDIVSLNGVYLCCYQKGLSFSL